MKIAVDSKGSLKENEDGIILSNFQPSLRGDNDDLEIELEIQPEEEKAMSCPDSGEECSDEEQ